jgi:hypothetical protein
LQVVHNGMTDQKTKPKMFYGYYIVAFSYILGTVSLMGFCSFGVFFNPMRSEFGWSNAIVSGPPSIALLVSGLTGILTGVNQTG